MAITSQQAKELAAECGFELAGIAAAEPLDDWTRFEAWRAAGFAGEMSYLTDQRGELRRDPRNLLPEAQSIVCVGKLYNTPAATSEDSRFPRISKYAWGDADYHDIVREGLHRLAAKLAERNGEPFHWRACVDTAPLLERSYAQAAGLGWIGKNTCLINQRSGSWFFLGELLVSLPFETDSPAPFRCGSCTRCIDACPTDAILPATRGGTYIDSNLCISYLTIEKRGPVEGDLAAAIGNHVFGCDICQDVCPWNRRAPFTFDAGFAPRPIDRTPEQLADLTREDFRSLFRHSPVWRAKYEGFLRNVAIALGNDAAAPRRDLLQKLAAHPTPAVSSAAGEALRRMDAQTGVNYRPSDTIADSPAASGRKA